MENDGKERAAGCRACASGGGEYAVGEKVPLPSHDHAIPSSSTFCWLPSLSEGGGVHGECGMQCFLDGGEDPKGMRRLVRIEAGVVCSVIRHALDESATGLMVVENGILGGCGCYLIALVEDRCGEGWSLTRLQNSGFRM
jgi:hypothetical protein